MPHNTKQRASILGVMNELAYPVTPSTLLKHASVKSPGLGIATVYRALKQLVENGKVRKIEISGVPPHYEVISENDHHHFFICEECLNISVLDGCPGGFKNILPAGSKIRSHEVIIYGECKDCVI